VRTTLRATLGCALALALAHPARADVSAAARAFADGQAAQLEGDYDHAAQSFELAYSIAPSKEALRSAIRARQLAGQLARSAMLAEILVAHYASDPTSAKLAADILGEVKPKLGRLVVACTAKCTVAIAGRAVSFAAETSHIVYVPAGKLTLEVSFEDGGSMQRDAIAVVGQDREIHVAPPAATPRPSRPPASPPPPPRAEPARVVARGRGLSPAVVIGGGVVTAGLIGAAVWSGLDTNKAHDAYVANPTHDAFVAGQSKQLRTNLLVGGAVATGVVTAAVAVWWTRWRGDDGPAVSLAPTLGGGLLVLGGTL
jgi:hypothetical protein